MKVDNTGTPVPHLKAWRKSALLSQRELGKRAGVSKYTILNIEVGRHRGAHNLTICKIADALGVTPKMLIEEVPE